MKRNIQNIIDAVYNTVLSHKLENEGQYARYIWQDSKNSRDMGINEYGCADAINILYTINKFPNEPVVRQKYIDALKGLQNPDTGLFEERTHHFIHTTAHCTAALELFDTRPEYPFVALDKYKTSEGLLQLLENLDWVKNPWDASHQGAGIYSALKLMGEIDKDWEDTYFNWLWDNADPKTGMWKKGAYEKSGTPLHVYMCSAFHYLFNIEYAKMPLRYPERLIDSCLDLYKANKLYHIFDTIGFIQIDWVYCVSRALRKCGYRYNECIEALRDYAKRYIDWLETINYATHDEFNDLHLLFGMVCVLSELQTVLPGEIITDKPLRLVLDRRPFI